MSGPSGTEREDTIASGTSGAFVEEAMEQLNRALEDRAAAERAVGRLADNVTVGRRRHPHLTLRCPDVGCTLVEIYRETSATGGSIVYFTTRVRRRTAGPFIVNRGPSSSTIRDARR